MTFKYNKQHGLKDCGASCLYNIIRYYNDFINQLLLFSLTDTLSIIFIFIYLLLNNLKVFLIISIIFFFKITFSYDIIIL